MPVSSLNQISLLDIALICPLIVTFTWSVPLIFSSLKGDGPKLYLGLFLLNMFVFFFATGSFYFATVKTFFLLDPFFMFSLVSIFPLLLLYIRSFASSNSQKVSHRLIHFLPAILFLAAANLYYLFNSDKNQQYHLYLTGQIQLSRELLAIEIINKLNKLVFIIQAVIYLIIIRKIIRRHKDRVASYHSNLEKLNIRWIRLFYFIYTVSVGIGVPALIGGHKSISGNNNFVLVSMFLLSIVFYLIAWIGYSQLPSTAEQDIIKAETRENGITDLPLLKTQLLHLFEIKKPYLNPDLKIQDIYIELSTNRTYLSRLINQEFCSNFCMFVNSYRIEEAKKIMANTVSKKYKTEEIGQQAGFNSYYSFVQAFRIFENTTPSKFRKERL